MQDLEAIVLRARELKDSAEREAYLLAVCGGDTALRRSVETLLRESDVRSGPGAETATTPPARTVKLPFPGSESAEKEEGPGTVIGHYKLLQFLGEGGYGVVYLAEQTEPVHRRVAFKVVKLGMDTREVVARFEAERQALALMDHPNIAKVLDAGATRTGRPYFVMELVKGIRITRYCDENKLSIRERLALYVQVCHAIQHAHQKGIIHRDIKPSNILVNLQDDVAVPKVIDFGIAKAIGQRLTDKTVFTRLEHFIGTPAYMSPEQAGVSGLDIDTRSDIYALGVLLYELLTGRTPFDPQQLALAGLEETLRRIREEEPPKPSRRLSALEREELTTTAQRRQTEPLRLITLLRGDLDWIVMKCLEKDRARRYETANALAMDLERFLTDEPVVARPPSSLYLLSKLVRRNKATFAAGGAVLAALVLGLGISLWGLFRARTEAVKSQEVARLLKDMLEGVGPSVALGRDVQLLREILDKTAQRVGTDLKAQPAVELELRATIGRTYEAVGEYAQAEAMQRQALDLAHRLYGNTHPNVAAALTDLGTVLYERNQLTNAEAVLREALEITHRLPGDQSVATGAALHQLGAVFIKQCRYGEAQPLLTRAIELRRQNLGPEHVDTLNSTDSLAVLYFRQRRYKELERLITGLVETECRVLRTNNPLTLRSMDLLALLRQMQGRFGDAEALHKEITDIKRSVYGPKHPQTLASMNSLAVVYSLEGRDREAEVLGQQVFEGLRERLGPEDLDVLGAMSNLAEYYRNQGRYAEAEGLFQRVVDVYRQKLPADHAYRLETLNSLAILYRLQGRYAEAEQLGQEVVASRRASSVKNDLDVADALAQLTLTLLAENKVGDAAPLARECLDIRRNQQPDEWQAYSARILFGACLLRQGHFDQAESWLLAGYEGMKQRLEKVPAFDRPPLLQGLQALVRLYESTGRPEKAAEWQEKLNQASGASLDGPTPVRPSTGSGNAPRRPP